MNTFYLLFGDHMVCLGHFQLKIHPGGSSIWSICFSFDNLLTLREIHFKRMLHVMCFQLYAQECISQDILRPLPHITNWKVLFFLFSVENWRERLMYTPCMCIHCIYNVYTILRCPLGGKPTSQMQMITRMPSLSGNSEHFNNLSQSSLGSKYYILFKEYTN